MYSIIQNRLIAKMGITAAIFVLALGLGIALPIAVHAQDDGYVDDGGSYADDGGSYADDGGSYADDCGCSYSGDTYSPDTYQPDYSSPDYSYSPDESYTPDQSYSPDETYLPDEGSYGSPSYSSGFSPIGSGFSMGFSSPIGQPVASAPVQEQQQSQGQSQGQSQNSTNVNSNPNTNTNTNVNNINIAPVQQIAPTQTQQYPVQYVFPQPTCTISANNGYNNYSYGSAPMTLTWSSSNATSAYISPNVGTVNLSGSTTVYPTGNQIYTMTVSGTGGTNTCQTTATYAVAPITYTQPVVNSAPYVTLSQIPYTGFDYGTVGDTIYWMALFAFAAALAYLAIYYRGGALAYAGALMNTNIFAKRSDDSEEETEEPVQPTPTPEPEEEEAASYRAPAYASVSVLPTQETNRITADSMIVARSADGAPRIVITRS